MAEEAAQQTRLNLDAEILSKLLRAGAAITMQSLGPTPTYNLYVATNANLPELKGK
jgi:hypothetical protein